MRAHARTSRKCARARFAASARVYSSCARVRARILTKINVLINSYLIRKSLKFRKDPSFRWGDIWLFVTMYDLDLKFLSFSKTRKSAILSGKKRTLLQFFFWWERWEVCDLPYAKNGLEIRLILTSHEWIEWTRIEESHLHFIMECTFWFFLTIC